MGAAWLAARHVKYCLPRDDTALCHVFYTYTPQTGVNETDNHTNGVNSDTNGISNTNGVRSNTNGVGSNTNAVSSNINGIDRVNGLNGKTEKVKGDLNVVDCGCDKWKNWSLL